MDKMMILDQMLENTDEQSEIRVKYNKIISQK